MHCPSCGYDDDDERKAEHAERDRLRMVLQNIARQMKTDETDFPEHADLEGGYDAIIEEAREAIHHLSE